MMADILIVDDVLFSLHSISSILENAGHRVIGVKNGEEGLNVALTMQFHLVISALYTNDITGVAFTKDLRKLPTYKDIPIVIISEDSKFNIKRNVLEAGCTDCLTRPFSPEDLIEIVNRLVVDLNYPI